MANPYTSLLDKVRKPKAVSVTKAPEQSAQDYWQQQYAKYSPQAVTGASLRSSGMGITPVLTYGQPKKDQNSLSANAAENYFGLQYSPPAKTTPPVPGVAAAAVDALGGPSATAPDTNLPAKTGPDIAEMLRQLSVPGVSGSFNVQMPTLSGVDLKNIYDKYAPMETSAYDTLLNTLSGIRQGAAATNQANMAATQKSYDALNADMAAGNAENKNALDALIQRLGLQEATARPAYQRIAENQSRLGSLIGLLQTGRQNTQQTLDSARMGNFDTLSQLAAGSKAKGLNDLLNAVVSGEIQGGINKSSAQNEIAKIISSGQVDFQKFLQQQKNQQLAQNLELLRVAQYMAAANAANASANAGPVTGTQTDTITNQDFWEGLRQATANNPTAAALFDKQYGLSGGDLNATQKVLANLALSSGGKTQIPNKEYLPTGSFAGGGGAFVNTGVNQEANDAASLLDLFKLLGSYGGVNSQRTYTTKIKG